MTDENPLLSCDPESGVCLPATLAPLADKPRQVRDGFEVIYVGDPMCSWCWGISPTLQKLSDHCALEGIPFTVIVGGLRPGGGDAWTRQFREFLRHHWEEIGQRTGQPFSFELLNRSSFNYDTEPACRAVVAARPLLGGPELPFFEAIQRKFYVDNEDPAEPVFYASLCERYGIDFDLFVQRFTSAAVREATDAEFRLNRSWGVRGYPTVLLKDGGRMTTLAYGFATLADMQAGIERRLAA